MKKLAVLAVSAAVLSLCACTTTQPDGTAKVVTAADVQQASTDARNKVTEAKETYNTAKTAASSSSSSSNASATAKETAKQKADEAKKQAEAEKKAWKEALTW
ncbi:mucin-associated surface protein (MASP) [Elusimicrobium minutum Pei191]|uniref:Mucin-associated surface protein (MASP) n=1 Tax=Elusimicrobium minutum (strain Pei191) TaxID=445932 RepID=B2KCE8_ELUMP|nr:hypothetical protein [Elusimicrobium minutum]ACC98069.1 mucin-associated surface protein (MASP) [Elusimicrobium minutum Pei191]